jgi:hypothetical protein
MPPRHPLHETRADTFGGPHHHVRKPKRDIGGWEQEVAELKARGLFNPPRNFPSRIESPYNADLPYASSSRGRPAPTSRHHGSPYEPSAAARAFERSYRGENLMSDEVKDV